MTLRDGEKETQQARKSLWPWLLLLALTLVAIYLWNTTAELIDDFSRNMPTAIIELFQGLLNETDRDGQPRPNLDVFAPVLFFIK